MDKIRPQWADVAEVLRNQRRLAQLSLRHLAKLTHVSDSYLSQIERGLHEPSPEVLKSIAAALNLPLNGLYERLGWLDKESKDTTVPPAAPSVIEAVNADTRLSDVQKRALCDMYLALIGPERA
jgi:transcriptional regulator with XRE-family HTH domain